VTTNLYEKYKAGHYPEMEAVNPLSFILRKAELGYDLTASELDWLDQHQLCATKEIIENQESYRNFLRKEVISELLPLRKNQFVYSMSTIPAVNSEIALTLY
jgi:hypothetical protein